MKEPLPQKTLPPQGAEPCLRVGIVLREDRKGSIFLSPTHHDYTLASGESCFTLSRGSKYEIINCDLNLFFKFPSGTRAALATPVSVRPQCVPPLAPQQGMQIENLSVGRGFHWQTSLTQILPGSFEIIADGREVVAVNCIGLEDYLACVLSSEMSPDSPPEFCKAQITAARSWAAVFLRNKHAGVPYAICNDDDCQRYRGTTDLNQSAIEAARACRGEFLITDDGAVCPAYYSKSCGGHLESAQNAFGFALSGLREYFDCSITERPALKLTGDEDFVNFLNTSNPDSFHCGREDMLKKYLSAVDPDGSYFRWRYIISKEELISNLRNKFGINDVQQIRDLIPGRRGISGRFLSLDLLFRSSTGAEQTLALEDQYEIRRALHRSFLFSSAFIFECDRDSNGDIRQILMRGAGWGHGVGLCQLGAVGMALHGFSYRDILKHYYPGTSIITAYD